MSDLGHNSGATPILDRIGGPGDMKALTPDQLKRLAGEVRLAYA